MRVTVFGAAGRVGRHVIAQALLRGHQVTAFVRNGWALEGADLGSDVSELPHVDIEESGRPAIQPELEEDLVHRKELGRHAAELEVGIAADRTDTAALTDAVDWLSELRDADGHRAADVQERVRSIGDPPTWSSREVLGVLRGIEGHGRVAEQLLLDANLWRVVTIARRNEGRGVPLVDLVVCGSIGLVAAVAASETARGTRFSVEAERSVQGAIANLVSERSAPLEPPHSTPGLAVIVGDARDAESVERALDRCDGAISVMALPAAEREFEHSEATRIVAEAATRTGVRRLVVTTCADVLADREVTGHRAPYAREDERVRDELRRSGLDWTIGAAPWVTDDPPTGRYEAVAEAKAPGRRLAAADFATFTLDALGREDWIGHVVGVSGPP